MSAPTSLTETGRRLGREIVAVLPAFLVARALVGAGYLWARIANDHLRPGQARPVALAQGLFTWDGAFYRDIAAYGYRAMDVEATRFFPLYPLLGRGVSVLTFGHVGAALVLVANAAALVALVQVRRLATREGHARVAGASVWWLALWPSAFVLALAYAEALFLVLALGTLAALRARRWGWAVAAGALAALTRPVGLALVLAAAVEVWRHRRALRGWPAVAAVGAVLAPVAGFAVYLAYAATLPGGWRSPLTAQDPLRGDLQEPLSRLARALGDLVSFSGDRTLDGLHALAGVALVVLVVLAFRWLPASYGLYSAAVVAVALGADNLNSLERYGLNAVPLVVVAAVAAQRLHLQRAGLLVAAGVFTALAALAFTGAYVP